MLCLQVVLEEGAGRRVIFSTFDPDCATLLSLKQPRFPVLFLTCGGTKAFQARGAAPAARLSRAWLVHAPCPAASPPCLRSCSCPRSCTAPPHPPHPLQDPRMNSLDAALQFALASQLQVGRQAHACPCLPARAAAHLLPNVDPPAAPAMQACPVPGRRQCKLDSPARLCPGCPPLSPQGVVAEASSVLGRLHEAVSEFHRHGLFL